jgi:hypothetical protein
MTLRLEICHGKLFQVEGLVSEGVGVSFSGGKMNLLVFHLTTSDALIDVLNQVDRNGDFLIPNILSLLFCHGAKFVRQF